ncbi:MAG: rhomboid family intramembrane serine protease [Lachnospiraceae bacterium]|nr:rhomboid family intramembrane serine protease [Lachnospiraceae bacterium]
MNKLKITFNSPAVLTFALLSFVAFLLNMMTNQASNRMLFMTYHSSLTDPLTYVRMFTHVLGHANWSHFIGNMSFILLLGPILEEKYGYGRIVEVILITAFITGVVHYIFFRNTSLLGASGVVFAFILLTSFTSFKKGEIPITFILIAVIYLGQQVSEAFFVTDNISNLSHIIGGVVGAFVGYTLNQK